MVSQAENQMLPNHCLQAISFSNRRLPIGENVIKLCDLCASLSGIVENDVSGVALA